MKSIAQRWHDVDQCTAIAAEKSGRLRKDITIVGVTKYVDVDPTRMLFQAGCHDLGESRPQSLWTKSDQLSDLPIRWHLIGHLQRNKSRRTIPIVQCVHSVDSLRLAQQISGDARELGIEVSILLEVNVSGDSNKTGMLPSELVRTATAIVELPNLKMLGLMGMAGLGNQEPRHDFAAIRQLRDQLQLELGSEVELRELSMGMSGDFEVAIQEGATMVRVGSILFDDNADSDT
ncbi:MAG: YggS family pyridoxal phosphate-dependent enzyme [Pirellulaceae bacterium]|nr:YggS family pyridoxal phosphate-dependent enzyme [Pirellulaceae bacterium]